MPTGTSEKRLADLRTALKFATPQHRPAIQAMIDALLAGERAASEGKSEYPEGRSGTAREAPSTGMRDGTAPSAVHTSAVASVGVQPAAPPGFPVQQRSLAELTRACALPGCGKPLPPECRGTHCSQECANEARRQWHKANPGGNRPTPAQAERGRAGGLAQRSRREREAMAREAEAASAEEARQHAVRPRWRLEWRPEVVIRPPRPAPVKRYTSGEPTPFQDDLDAIADHGSPERLPSRPPSFVWAASTLAAAS